MSPNYQIRPDGDGLRAVLFDLEADIMQVIWSDERRQWSVNDVLDVLSRDRDIAYTTVMTTMKRLADKGILGRARDGRKYLYEASMTREAFLAGLARDVFERLPDIGKDAATAFLVDRIGESDLEELDRLEALIRKRKAES